MSNKIYQMITDRIIAKVEAGQPLPWQKPWKPGSAPKNISGRAYSGVNTFTLDMEKEDKGYKSNTWLTFNQVMERGGDITGQKTTPVIFVKFFDNEEGERKFSMRYYNVFNADQVKGLTLPTAEPMQEIDPIEAAETLVNNMPNRPKMTTNSGARACYFPSLDEVSMPPRNNFTNSESFYRVLFHELGHSTQHASRLNREVGAHVFGSQDYSKEELVAEMTAAFLMGVTGIENDTQNEANAAYIKSWLKALKDDTSLIVKAASQAQKAADYIQGTYKPAASEE
jgi:antirestriction protein ArdC